MIDQRFALLPCVRVAGMLLKSFMKFLLIVGCLFWAAGAPASDLAKIFENQLEAVFAGSPVAVEGWIKRMDGTRGRTEFRWSTQDKAMVKRLHDFLARMRLTHHVIPSPGGISAGVYLRISSAPGVGKEVPYVYVTYSGAFTQAVSASHDAENHYFDELVRLVYPMYARDAKVKVIQ